MPSTTTTTKTLLLTIDPNPFVLCWDLDQNTRNSLITIIQHAGVKNMLLVFFYGGLEGAVGVVCYWPRFMVGY